MHLPFCCTLFTSMTVKTYLAFNTMQLFEYLSSLQIKVFLLDHDRDGNTTFGNAMRSLY